MSPSRLPVAVLLATAALFAGASPAAADVASLVAACVPADAADGNAANGLAMPFRFCDDGVPDQGGRTPNPGAARAIAVPQRYAGVDGLPAKATPDPNAGADANGDIALDVNLSLPDPARHPRPAAGYPLLVLMHGCCAGSKGSWESGVALGGGEKWRYNNAFFASRGYVVATYTSRGFVTSLASGHHGSTGETQLDDARYEMNDLQHMAGRLADTPELGIDPTNVVVTGGSYGGGFTWMALTDPTWTSPGGRAMRLRAVAPKYGWTDLVQSLVPNGTSRDRLPAPDGSDSASPLGFAKRSILTGLFGAGQVGFPLVGLGSQATFPPAVAAAFTCLQSADPYESDPACADTLRTTLPEFLRFRSAYYQQRFFDRLAAGDRTAMVPVFSAGAFTDQLFPSEEHRRMVERIKAAAPGYPVQEYYGDYQHFTLNKAKEWGDVCGADHHVCRYEDFPGGNLDAEPAGLVRRGVTSRLTDFLDHYAKPPANAAEPAPRFDVTASLQSCRETADALGVRPDEPGPTFTAPSFAELAPGSLKLTIPGERTTTNKAAPNAHAASADPVANSTARGAQCLVETSAAGAGVATYDSAPLGATATMIGRTRVAVSHRSAGTQLMLAVRLYDLRPDGGAILVDRGVRRIPAGGGNGTTNVDLHGNGWRFEAGHRLRVEVAQDDDPYIRSSNVPSSMTLSGVSLDLPVREGAPSAAPAAKRCVVRRGFVSASARPRGRGLRVAFRRRARRPVSVDLFRVTAGRRVSAPRRVARMRGRSRSFSWRGRGLRDGLYFVRLSTPARGGGTDVRRFTVERTGGRWRARPAFYRRASCGTIGSFKLGGPAFGGATNRSLSIAFRLGVPGRTTVTLLRGSRTLRALRTAEDSAPGTVRLTLPARGLRRGEHRIRLRVVPARGGRAVTATLTARRL